MNLFPRVLLLALYVTLAISGCKKDLDKQDDPWDPTVSRSLTNEAYAAGARSVMDVYLPANRNANTRVLLMLHGGGWNAGDKSDMTGVVQAIQQTDPSVAIMNMNYTLVDGTTATRHPAQMIDIDNAVKHILQNQALWQVSNNISILGVSAGAHLALMYGLDYDKEKKIKALLDIIGPSNFGDPFYTANPLFQALAVSYIGATWQQNPALHQALSPVNFVTAQSPPTLMAYAGQDALVPTTNATALRDKYHQQNVTHEYYFYPTEQHELSGAAIADILSKAVPFLQNHGR